MRGGKGDGRAEALAPGGFSSNWNLLLTCWVNWKPHCASLDLSFPHKLKWDCKCQTGL